MVARGEARSISTWGLARAKCPNSETRLPSGPISASSGNGEAPKPLPPIETTQASGYSSNRRRRSASVRGSKLMSKARSEVDRQRQEEGARRTQHQVIGPGRAACRSPVALVGDVVDVGS